MAEKRGASPKKALGKRRTREHIIADLSVNLVQRIILDSGCAGSRRPDDYGYDFFIETFDPNGIVEPGFIFLQLKATDNIFRYELAREDCFAFPIDRRDAHLWAEEVYPVLLVLYDAVGGEAYWQHLQVWFAEHPIPAKSKNLSVRIPKHHVLGIGTIQIMQRRKKEQLRAIQE